MENTLSLEHIPPIAEDNSTNGRLKRLSDEIMKLPPEKIDQVEHFVKSMGKRALSLKEAAQMLNVSSATLRRAIKSGRIKAFQLAKAGDFRISIEEIEHFIGGKQE